MPMNKILTSLIEFLEAKSLSYDPDEEAQAVRLGIEAANLRWRCFACKDDSGRFVFVSLIPIKAPEARRVACAEVLSLPIYPALTDHELADVCGAVSDFQKG